MKRREFARLAGLSVIAISATGFLKFNGENYVADCVTTTDILGPFYRPDSPLRTNLVIKDMPGEIVELSGKIRHKDCLTAYKNAKIELWHCSHDGVYDNSSDEFRYRGTTISDDEGKYKFITQMPVPYDTGGGNYRPAHFHLLITANGYKSLITQIYFKDDPYLLSDPSSSSPQAKERILKLKKNNDIYKIGFDCNMNDVLKVTDDSIQKITGEYRNIGTGTVVTFFARDGDLWVKNEVFGKIYTYSGNNSFEYGGLPEGMFEKLDFKLEKDGEVSLTKTTSYGDGKQKVNRFKRLKAL
ncbi:catechol 1,2-dioxygenase [Christiangramia sabulilitoris]|uniref:Catechol 1,2-dioxygenase n=1 Tax=Christiangramia sabulilitoris TaxID=2583991 RepID=A0A550I064_9FLAO|nr:catechol 1,2-dioxygenase [Christiangramia sabulilitoris]TRO64377.1 catechol 1,2-dioxygenase [Christiangramia sabulilitoris]